jgi:hypothetical protein
VNDNLGPEIKTIFARFSREFDTIIVATMPVPSFFIETITKIDD